jgi:hypothetical protein
MLTLDESETELVREVLAYIDSKYPGDGETIRGRLDCLNDLGKAVSQFPSVRETQVIRGEVRDERKLIESLYNFAPPSRLLHVPTRIVATRGYLVAKSHFFSMVFFAVQDIEQFYSPLRKVIFSVIYTLMVEEVYFSCLNDPEFSDPIRFRLANDLVELWDSGVDPHSNRNVPALETLWMAREATPPTFGTMDGASELVRISIDMNEDWHDFLVRNIGLDDTRWALEEFIFGLSYEEILEVRARLHRFGIQAVGFDEVRSYLGSHPSYTIVTNNEPRAGYDFYVDRRDMATFRRRVNAPGPQSTLEEIYLKYRIAKE